MMSALTMMAAALALAAAPLGASFQVQPRARPLGRGWARASAALVPSAEPPAAAGAAGAGPMDEWFVLPGEMKEALEARAISSPTPIQRAAFPVVSKGYSCMLHATTGSGKTLAMMLPILAKLREELVEKKKVVINQTSKKVLIIVPTRELAAQHAAGARDLLRGTNLHVALLTAGETPTADALASASVIATTPVGAPPRRLRFRYNSTPYMPHRTLAHPAANPPRPAARCSGPPHRTR